VILGSAVIVLPLALAIAGADFFIERNVIAAWAPVAIASGALLGARCASWWGPALAGLLCLGGIVGHLEVLAKPSLQRENWRAAAGALGNPVRPRAVVIYPPWMRMPLRVYRQPLGRFAPGAVRVGEVDLVDGGRPPRLTPPPGFRLTERKKIGRITVRRYTTPSLVPVTRNSLAVGVRIPMSVRPARREFERGIRAAVAYQPEGSGRAPTP
jgi:hypothetical protein